ncbi:MAG: FtsW/RodA/SpoVE family cell cycle protein [Candidatus Gracilibacteria bacterium]|nr:FtsW/RodA/SpoVE family cell cycle protein [Candidatus Gracilibacteria bacterium]
MKTKSIDYPLFFAILILVIFGVIMISSVSVYSSYKVTSAMVAAGNLKEPNNYFYLLRSLINLLVSFCLFAFIVKIPYGFFEKNAKNFFIAGVIGLVAVLLFGAQYNGTKGWLNIPFLPSIQPVEFFKIFFIIYIASYLKKKKNDLKDFKNGFVSFMLLLGAVVLLLGLQPDFGSILIIVPVSILLFYFGGGNTKYIFITFLIGLIFVSFIYGLGKHKTDTDRNYFSYITDRMDSFLSDKKKIAESNKAEDFQIKQGLIAIGSGGFFGLGFGGSIQKFGYLPEVQGDFVFSVIAEEFGFFGILILMFFYLFIALRGYTIADSVEDLYGKYLVFGITTLIVFQAFINIGVNLNIIPLTGVTLPFVSYGGSSFMSMISGVGIILTVSRHSNFEKMNSILLIKRGNKRFFRKKITG